MFLVLFKTYTNDHNLHSWLVVIDREARDFLLSYILFLVKLKVFLIYETGSFMKLEVYVIVVSPSPYSSVLRNHFA